MRDAQNCDPSRLWRIIMFKIKLFHSNAIILAILVNNLSLKKWLNPWLAMFLVDLSTGEMEFRLHVEKTKYETIFNPEDIPEGTNINLNMDKIENDFNVWAASKLWKPEMGPNRDETGKPVLTKEYIQFMVSEHGPQVGDTEAIKKVEEKVMAYKTALSVKQGKNRKKNSPYARTTTKRQKKKVNYSEDEYDFGNVFDEDWYENNEARIHSLPPLSSTQKLPRVIPAVEQASTASESSIDATIEKWFDKLNSKFETCVDNKLGKVIDCVEDLRKWTSEKFNSSADQNGIWIEKMMQGAQMQRERIQEFTEKSTVSLTAFEKRLARVEAAASLPPMPPDPHYVDRNGNRVFDLLAPDNSNPVGDRFAEAGKRKAPDDWMVEQLADANKRIARMEANQQCEADNIEKFMARFSPDPRSRLDFLTPSPTFAQSGYCSQSRCRLSPTCNADSVAESIGNLFREEEREERNQRRQFVLSQYGISYNK